ncbi:MAG: RNA-binding protein [Planctomycetota bacterium]
MINIYVGNLPYDTQEDQLIEHFTQWGQVERATLVFDRETGRPRGFGFVEMEDTDEAAKAIEEAHGQPFNGRPLTVNEARPRGSGQSTGRTYASTTEAAATGADGAANGYRNRMAPAGAAAPVRPPARPQPAPAEGGGGYSNQLYG